MLNNLYCNKIPTRERWQLAHLGFEGSGLPHVGDGHVFKEGRCRDPQCGQNNE